MGSRPPPIYSADGTTRVTFRSPADPKLVLTCVVVERREQKRPLDEHGDQRLEWRYKLLPLNPPPHPYINTAWPVWAWESDIVRET